MNQHKIEAIKQEFGDDLTTPLEGWNAVTGDIVPPVAKSSLALFPTTTTQSVSIQPSPPATTSNDTTASTSPPSNVNKTNPNVASVRANPANGNRQGLVKKVERNNNNRPVIVTRSHKFVPIASNLQQTNITALSFNVEQQLKQTQEQLKDVTAKLADNRNAYEILEKKYDDLKSYTNKSIEELKADNAKLHDRLDQLIASVNANETSRANANINIKQEYEDGETAIDDVESDHVKMELKEEFEEETNQLVGCSEPVIKGEFDYGQEIEIKQEDEEKDESTDSEEMVDIKEEFKKEVEEEVEETAQQISDTPNNELTELTRQVTQIVNTHFESPTNEDNLVDLFEVDEDEHCETRGDRKRELDCEGVDTERAVKRQQTSELMNGEDGVSRANEGGEQGEVNEHAINAQAELIDQSPRQSTDEAQPNQMNNQPELNQDRQYVTVHLKCPQLDCTHTFPEDQLNQHMREKHFIGPNRCLVCAQSFDNHKALGQHIREVHSDTTEWHCGKCSKNFHTYQRLAMHNSNQHQLGLFHCSFPSCTFKGEYKMKMHDHYKRQHKPKPTLNCPQPDCNYQTSNPTCLKQHQRVHSAIKPYRCKWPECDYSSARQTHTINHIRRHLALNPSSAPNGTQLVDPKDYLEVVRVL